MALSPILSDIFYIPSLRYGGQVGALYAALLKHLGISEKKSRLRKQILVKREQLSPIKKIEQYLDIERKFFALPEYSVAKVIAFYASKADEFPTDGLIEKSLKAGKRVVLPRTIGRELIWGEIKNMRNLEIGDFAVREPSSRASEIDLKKIDLMIVPLLACDLKGNRLGYGTGFYDRVLEKFKGASIGFAFDIQVVPKVPVTKWDKKLDKVFSTA